MLLFENESKILVTAATFWPMETPSTRLIVGDAPKSLILLFFSLVVDVKLYSSEYFQT